MTERLLDTIAEDFRNHRGRLSKQALRHVTDAFGATDWITGPGDDTAVVAATHGTLLAAGEAMYPPFIATDPFGAGVGAVVANVNDVAAMGGRPLAIVDTVVAPAPIAQTVLSGLHHAAELYGVPVVGGHLTLSEGPPALSAFVVGEVTTPLLASNAAPGQSLLLAACLDGQVRGDFPFFPSHRERGDLVRGDVEVLPALAEGGDVVAAKDVSMAGLLGTLAMLLQPTGSGATVLLDHLPRPAGVPLGTWLGVFPSYAFLLCAPPARVERCLTAFAARGLACAEVGTIDGTGALRVRLGDGEATLLDDTCSSGTGLQGAR